MNGGSLKSTQFMIDVFTQTTGGRPSAIACHDSPASFDPKTGVVSYQVTQKLRDKSCTVILTAKSGDKKVEAHWTFGIDESGAAPAATSAATPKK